MKQVFRLLVDLQQTDTELKALNDKHAAVPGRIAELRRSAEELKAGFEATRQSIVEHRKQYKLAEVDLRSAEEKAGTYSVQLYAAKTNEQYKAFLKEIEAQKRLASQVEDRMLSLMEKLEALESGVKATEKQTAEVDVDVARKVALLET
ncbi:hypothetical protein FJY71_02075, partial [candidate division WOR-3 bacterium]|nr:hypothetical protein [candidate division WOR-3 bacterium]